MTRVALLWHMHQPFYQDLRTGEHVMPWVRLHAIKDYWGMVALLEEFPAVRLTFNLVPSMLTQLEAFARNDARDHHLDLGLKPADALSMAERIYCLEEFFHAHPGHMIHPHARYAELRARRGDVMGRGVRPHDFSVEDLRDLQVWHKLVWIDPMFGQSDSRVRRLLAKGRDYDEHDKQVLREVELELLGKVIPAYRDAAERGQIELSTSPFYHPILPLLCDTDVYRRTHPDSAMPREPFRHPEDAALQLERAVRYHEQLFGHKPKGLWPSEGSVSDAMIRVVAEAGFSWMATDEEILGRSLHTSFTRDNLGSVNEAGLLYRPYRVGPESANLGCGFRDHALSDLIGFTYASWDAEVAAEDFVRRLVAAGESFNRQTGGGEEPTIFVILDGENAWEHYREQGRPFLRALYRRLGETPGLTTVTMSEACERSGPTLPSIFPGSWINGDFYVWIGHRDDHRAWSQLVDARRALNNPPPGISAAALALAQEELLVAEGSDWFWWYGDDHSSDHDAVFDDLFRRHVRNIYEALGVAAPDELLASNITTAAPLVTIHQPDGVLSPQIDGEHSSYFEWLGAGGIEFASTAGAMHQVSDSPHGLSRIAFGFDAHGNLAVRMDTTIPARDLLAEPGLELVLRFLTPEGRAVFIGMTPSGIPEATFRTREDGWLVRPCPGLRLGVGEIAEVLIPAASVVDSTTGRMRFVVEVRRAAGARAQYPKDHPIEAHAGARAGR